MEKLAENMRQFAKAAEAFDLSLDYDRVAACDERQLNILKIFNREGMPEKKRAPSPY